MIQAWRLIVLYDRVTPLAFRPDVQVSAHLYTHWICRLSGYDFRTAMA